MKGPDQKGWRMNEDDKDSLLTISGDGLSVQSGGNWFGSRSTMGVIGSGKYYFEVEIRNGLGRVGWSTTAAR